MIALYCIASAMIGGFFGVVGAGLAAAAKEREEREPVSWPPELPVARFVEKEKS